MFFSESSLSLKSQCFSTISEGAHPGQGVGRDNWRLELISGFGDARTGDLQTFFQHLVFERRREWQKKHEIYFHGLQTPMDPFVKFSVQHSAVRKSIRKKQMTKKTARAHLRFSFLLQIYVYIYIYTYMCICIQFCVSEPIEISLVAYRLPSHV